MAIPTPLKGSDHRGGRSSNLELARPKPNCEILIKQYKKAKQIRTNLLQFTNLVICVQNACDEYASLAVQVLELLSSVPRREGGDGVGTHQNT